MKNILTTTVLLSFFLITSCSTTKNKSSSNVTSRQSTISEVDKSGRVYTSLADYLRTKSNIIVQGTGENVRLQIRGVSSLTSDTRPFIYVNKNPMGRDYSRVNNFINPNDITRVKVLSSLADLTRYGQEGHSGIVIIYTKSDTSK